MRQFDRSNDFYVTNCKEQIVKTITNPSVPSLFKDRSISTPLVSLSLFLAQSRLSVDARMAAKLFLDDRGRRYGLEARRAR